MPPLCINPGNLVNMRHVNYLGAYCKLVPSFDSQLLVYIFDAFTVTRWGQHRFSEEQRDFIFVVTTYRCGIPLHGFPCFNLLDSGKALLISWSRARHLWMSLILLPGIANVVEYVLEKEECISAHPWGESAIPLKKNNLFSGWALGLKQTLWWSITFSSDLLVPCSYRNLESVWSSLEKRSKIMHISENF